MNRHQRRKRSLVLKARYQLAENEKQERLERESIIRANHHQPETKEERIWRQARSSYSQFAGAVPQGVGGTRHNLYDPSGSRGERPLFQGNFPPVHGFKKK